jgi:hypothetical protein
MLLIVISSLFFYSSAFLQEPWTSLNYTLSHSHFANLKYRSVSESSSHTIIFPATSSERQHHTISSLNRNLKVQEAINLVQSSDYFEFIPVFKGSLKFKGEFIEFKNSCFRKTKITLKELTEEKLVLELDVQNSYNPMCTEDFLFALIRHRETETIFWSGIHLVEFKGLKPDDTYDIMKNGVRVFSLKENYITTIASLINTFEMFLGGLINDPDIPVIGSKVPDYMVEANLAFLEQNMNIKLAKRSIKKVENIEDYIESGDMLGLMRMDGFSTLIMYITGGRTSHTAMALWMEENGKRKLYVVESQYGQFTPQNGVQKTPFSSWIKAMENASYSVVLLKLNELSRSRFNEKLAIMEFNKLEGFPYGFHNLAFGQIDTPDHNFPSQLSPQFIEVSLRMLEEVFPPLMRSFIGEALNIRLETQNLKIDELVIEAAKRNLTISEVMAIPEQDEWVYSTGKSFTCSGLLSHLYRASGVLSHLYFQATEFTPRDLYSLNIFDTVGKDRPKACIEADPDIPYCQLIGDFRIDVTKELSTISPYHYMFEKCESEAPEYIRSKFC